MLEERLMNSPAMPYNPMNDSYFFIQDVISGIVGAIFSPKDDGKTKELEMQIELLKEQAELQQETMKQLAIYGGGALGILALITLLKD